MIKTSEKQYRNIELDSYSSLKVFANDKKSYYKKFILKEDIPEDEETIYTKRGNLVETLLLEPNEFEVRFFITSVESIPGDKMGEFVELLYKNQKNNPDSPFEDIMKKTYEECSFKLPFQTVVKKFVGSDAEIYYKELLEIREKKLIPVSLKDVEIAQAIANKVKNYYPIYSIITDENAIYQFKIEKFFIDNYPLKAMVDIVLVDEKNKIIKPYDLKCVWSVNNFYYNNYLKGKLYIQAYLYTQALKSAFGEEYKVESLRFIVIDSNNHYKPFVLSTDNDDIKDAYNGFTNNGFYYPGVKEIIQELKYSIENNSWDTYSIFENQKEINVKLW